MKHSPWIKCKAIVAIRGKMKHTHKHTTHTVKHGDILICDTQGHTINILLNNSEQTVSDQGDLSVTVGTNKMITSTFKHNMAGSAGDWTY